MFGYFFGPRLAELDAASVDLDSKHAIVCAKFGDLGLVTGDWPVIGLVREWDSNAWPFPSLARIDLDAGKAWLADYDDRLNIVREWQVSLDEATLHPLDGLYGSQAIAIELDGRVRAS